MNEILCIKTFCCFKRKFVIKNVWKSVLNLKSIEIKGVIGEHGFGDGGRTAFR